MSLSYKEQPVAYIAFSVLLVVLAVFSATKTWNAYVEHKYIGKPSTVRDTIMIEGTGKVAAKPTLALVQFSVVSQAATASAAQTDNTNKMNAVIQAMKDLQIKEDDLTTSGYNMSPVYDYAKNPYTILGYSVTQTLSVKIRNFDKIGNVLERGVSLGVNQVNNIQFTIDEPESSRDEARVKALQNAQKKADALARALGVEIVRVVSFSESALGYQPQMPYYRDSGVMSAQAAPAPEIQPGTQDVEMNVSVTYEIR